MIPLFITSQYYLFFSITLIEIARNNISFTKKKFVIKIPSDTFQVFGVVIRKLSVDRKITVAKTPEKKPTLRFFKPTTNPIATMISTAPIRFDTACTDMTEYNHPMAG